MNNQADLDEELNSDSEIYSDSNSREENSSTQSGSDTTSTSQTDEDTADSDFHPDTADLESNESSGDEPDILVSQGINSNSATSRQELKRQLHGDPVKGDNYHQHAVNIKRLIRQAESSGRCSYLGPAVGWDDEEQLFQFFRSIDEEIPDVAKATGNSH
jgi:hypothetical protein